MNLDEVEASFRVLGLEPGASLEDVKTAFKFSLQAYHPDKYQEGTSSHRMAVEKLLVVKEANELLRKFFLECPTGEPEGGWRKPPDSEKESGPCDSADWAQWEKAQNKDFESELHAWEAREVERQKVTRTEHGIGQRQKLVSYGKVGLVIIVFCLWSGKLSSNAYDNMQRRAQGAIWMERARFNAQTQGVANGYRRSQQSLLDEANSQARALKERWQQEDFEKFIGLVFLAGLTGGTGWLLFAKRPKEYLNNWVSGQ